MISSIKPKLTCVNVYIHIIAFILTSRILDFYIPEVIYYATIMVVLVINLYFLPSIKLLDKNFLLFLLAIFFSILFNDIPIFFRPYQRYISFLIIILLFSAVISSDKLVKFRVNIFFAILNILSFYTIISFMGLLAGVFPLVGKGGFQGITNHSMMMSPIAGISALYMTYHYLCNKKNYIYIILGSVCLIVTLIAGSRAALMSMFLGFIFFLYKDGLITIKAFPKVMFGFVLIGLFLVVIPQDYFGRVSQKFEYGNNSGSVLFSRESLWETRISEFNNNPIFGCGFSSIDTRLTTDFGDLFDAESGNIEPGTSWGAVLSMCGLLGFICFLVMCISRFRAIVRSGNNTNNALISSIFVFFMFHMIFEGYIFASGSILMLLFWLTYFMTFILNKR